MEICAHHGLPVIENNITLESLLDADEVFATTTGGGIIPVTVINGDSFSNNVAGELTKGRSDTYWRWHSDTAMNELISYG